jgi:phosphate starvation-inducible PhoH-like protein
MKRLFSLILYSTYSVKIRSKKIYVPKTDNQIDYVKSLYNKNIDLLYCIGPAGTGKTLFACKYAIEEIDSNHYNKIIITRPTIPIEEDMGFLPGNIKEKMYPWTIPIFDIFEEYYSKKEINKKISDNIVEIAPLGFMQGRTFKNSIIIADEMQNSTPNQMFMLLTRIGENSKMIITGDLMQTKNEKNGLNDIIQKLENSYNKEEIIKKRIKICYMKDMDIQRHPIVYEINNLYKSNN